MNGYSMRLWREDTQSYNNPNGDGWFWRDDWCDEDMGPFETRDEALGDYEECRSKPLELKQKEAPK